MAEDQNRTLQDKFMLRFPDGMRDEIKLAADVNGRSMNAEIIHRLKNAFYRVEDGGPRIKVSQELYDALSLDSFGRGQDPDERAAEILNSRFDSKTDYDQMVDALAAEKLKNGDVRDENKSLKNDLERDFVLYYGKTLQISQFIAMLLRDAGDTLPEHVRSAARDLEELSKSEIEMLRDRYEDGLFRVKRQDNRNANDKSIATDGEE
jgi:hypothetical protein